MRTRRLGKTDYQVSEIGLGCWQLGGDFGEVTDADSTEILKTATGFGVTFWDTADVYGAGLSESRIGAARHKPRGLHVATKVGRSGELFPDKYTKAGMRRSLEGSATRLGVARLDLAQLHCVPRALLADGAVFDWMDEFKRDGLVAHWGASVETVEEGLLCLGHTGLSTLQIIFNIFRQDAVEKLLPLAAEADVGIIVRLPLASGLLSGKFSADHVFAKEDHRHYNRDGQAFNVGETFAGLPFAEGVRLADKAKRMLPDDQPLAESALRWILDHEQVSTIIAGVTKPYQLAQNVGAANLPPLGPERHAALSAFYRNEVRPLVRGGI
ncbi:MAG: aldo/keto reductase [Alphaproteobacteria bacterium]|nr:aldo/keto reductase [Alphaproteobacteria bacterium]